MTATLSAGRPRGTDSADRRSRESLMNHLRKLAGELSTRVWAKPGRTTWQPFTSSDLPSSAQWGATLSRSPPPPPCVPEALEEGLLVAGANLGVGARHPCCASTADIGTPLVRVAGRRCGLAPSTFGVSISALTDGAVAPCRDCDECAHRRSGRAPDEGLPGSRGARRGTMSPALTNAGIHRLSANRNVDDYLTSIDTQLGGEGDALAHGEH